MATKYPPEQIFEIDWNGPYTFEQLKEYDADDPGFTNSLSLYAKYQDHPLYGREVLTYIGKVTSENRTVIDRLKDKDHDLGHEIVYTGTIYKFENWADADKKNFRKDEYIRYGEGHENIISRIEELLIYGLWPAGNKRNKNTAKHSWEYRIFNTGYLGSLPPEVSGHYALYNAPKPDA